jgi:hypothetical protein
MSEFDAEWFAYAKRVHDRFPIAARTQYPRRLPSRRFLHDANLSPQRPVHA